MDEMCVCVCVCVCVCACVCVCVCDMEAIKQYCKNPNMKYYCTYQKKRETKNVLSGNVNGKKCVHLFLLHFCFISSTSLRREFLLLTWVYQRMEFEPVAWCPPRLKVPSLKY